MVFHPTHFYASKSGVGNSSLFLDESPFRQIRQMFEPRNVVLNIDEFAEMEIRPKIGMSCRRLIQMVGARVSFIVANKKVKKVALSPIGRREYEKRR